MQSSRSEDCSNEQPNENHALRFYVVCSGMKRSGNNENKMKIHLHKMDEKNLLEKSGKRERIFHLFLLSFFFVPWQWESKR